MTTDDEMHADRPPTDGQWIVIPRNVLARRLSGEPVELPRWVSRDLIEYVPGSVAIENCAIRVDATPATFTMLLAEDYEADAFERLRFILNRSFETLVASRERVARLIEVAYGSPTGAREVSECGLRFRARCPMTWDELRTTPDASVRLCDTCRQPVYFCENDEQARLRAAAGQCVAIEVVERGESSWSGGLLGDVIIDGISVELPRPDDRSSDS